MSPFYELGSSSLVFGIFGLVYLVFFFCFCLIALPFIIVHFTKVYGKVLASLKVEVFVWLAVLNRLNTNNLL